jgi:2-succinyl-6-hydroxy-2,4-cyclohexadiene-1-carboxylate synthase
VDGLRLHVELRGEGAPLLILHGFTGATTSMAPVAEGLAGGHLAVSVDLLGHGRSDAPREIAPYSMSRCVAQLRELLERLELPRVHLLGYSMGGRVALAFCAAHPERVRSVLAIGASPGIAEPAARAQRRRDDEALADRIEQQGLAAFVDAWMAQPLFATQRRRLSARSLAAARAQRLENRPHGLANSLRGMGTGAQPPLHTRLEALDVPVCLVAGADDGKFGAIAEALAARLRRGRVARIAEAGHAAHLENPRAFLRVARGWLADREQGAAPRRIDHTNPLQGEVST